MILFTQNVIIISSAQRSDIANGERRKCENLNDSKNRSASAANRRTLFVDKNRFFQMNELSFSQTFDLSSFQLRLYIYRIRLHSRNGQRTHSGALSPIVDRKKKKIVMCNVEAIKFMQMFCSTFYGVWLYDFCTQMWSLTPEQEELDKICGAVDLITRWEFASICNDSLESC